MRLSSLHKLIFTSVIAIFVVGVLVTFAWFLMRKVDTIRSQIAETNAAIASMEDQRKRMGSFTRLIEDRRSDFDRIGRFFVDDTRPVVFIETLEDLARKTGSTVALTAGGGTISEEEFTFDLKVEGGAGNVQKYLRLLELLPHEVRIVNYDYEVRTLTGASEEEVVQNAVLNTTIRVKTRS